MNAITGLLAAVSGSSTLTFALKAVVITAATLAILVTVRRASAAVRHVVLAAGFAALIGLPGGLLLTPTVIEVAAPQAAVAPPVLRAPLPVPPPATRLTVGPAAPASTVPAMTWRPSLPPVAVLWVFGAGIFLVPVLTGLFQLRTLRASRSAWPRGESALRRIASAAGINRRIEVGTSTLVQTPLTFGLHRPVVLLPDDAAGWPDSHLEFALRHELAHITRHDWLLQLLTRVAAAIYWCNPLVWVMWRQLRLEAERACDDIVIRQQDAATYASQLVTLAKRLTLVRAHPLVSMADRRQLAVRVRSLLDEHRRREAAPALLKVAASAVATLVVVLLGPLQAGLPVNAQTPAPAVQETPRFEVASVKPNADPLGANGTRLFQALPGGRVNLINQTVRELIYSSHQMQDFAVIGGPAWLGQERFDVIASAGMNATPPQMLPMVRTLLADRFRLAMHRETRELPIYNLVRVAAGRLGTGIKPSACFAVPPGQAATAQPPAGTLRCGNWGGFGELLSGGTMMQGFANRLGRVPAIGRAVVDRTGITGVLDIELRFTPDTPGATPPPDAVSIFTALEEQLGLRLEAARGPVEVLVIDSVERPTPD